MLSQVETIRRIFHDYTTGVVHNAQGWYGMPAAALRILRARLRAGVGPRQYSLFCLNTVAPGLWDDYLTDVPSFKRYLRSQSPSEMHRFADDKAVFHAHCQAVGLPTPPIVCVVGRRPNLHGSVLVVDNAADLFAALAAAPPALFAKQVEGTFGIGAFTIDREADEFRFEDEVGSAQSRARRCAVADPAASEKPRGSSTADVAAWAGHHPHRHLQ